MKVLSFSLIVFNLFISSASRIFLSYMYGEMRTVFGCSQWNCPWHSFVYYASKILYLIFCRLEKHFRFYIVSTKGDAIQKLNNRPEVSSVT